MPATRSRSRTTTANGKVEVEVSVSTVTPADAEAFLKGNLNNRHIRPTKVREYAREMNEGRWHLNGEPLIFDQRMKLIDGQHRLLACIQADVPFQTVIVRGIPANAKPTIDTGMRRTFGDVLRWQGEIEHNVLASIIRFCLKYDQGSILDPMSQPTIGEMLDYLKENPQIRGSISHARHARKVTAMTMTSLGSVHYLTWRVDPGDADTFMGHLAEQTDLEEGSAILMLIRWSQTHMAGRDTPDRFTQAAMTMKAINAWRQGVPLRNLTWRRGGAKAEEFPLVWQP